MSWESTSTRQPSMLKGIALSGKRCGLSISPSFYGKTGSALQRISPTKAICSNFVIHKFLQEKTCKVPDIVCVPNEMATKADAVAGQCDRNPRTQGRLQRVVKVLQ